MRTPSERARSMASVPRRGLLICALGALLGTLVVGFWAPGVVDTAISQALRRNEVAQADLDRPVRGGQVSFLVVGSDRREGLPADIAALGPLTSERADVVMLWLLDSEAGLIRVVSVSRYLRVHVAGHGTQMLAGSLEYGAPALIRAVRSVAGVPVHHYVELDLSGVRDLVEAAGGITVLIPMPVRDRVTHLDLQAGRQRLDGDQALAYLRSRQNEELRHGRWVPADQGDDGRIGRQQRFVHALLRRVAELDDAATLAQVLVAFARRVTVDQTMRSSEVAELRTLLTQDPTLTTQTLPTRSDVPAESVSPFPPLHAGRVSFRELDEPAASLLLRDLRSTGPAIQGRE